MTSRKTRHSTYNINYHFVWIPKYRRPILTGPICVDLESLMTQYAAKNEVEILSLSIQPDHVHLFVSAPPRLSKLKRRGSLWTRSYYVGTAGTVSSETIQHYIDECQSE